jgi:flagellin
MRVSHNIASLNIYTSYKSALAAQSKAMSRVSSGRRVNQASDDPYADAKDVAFTMQSKGLQMANTNAQDGISLLQTAEGGLSGINSMLDRIKTLANQAGNGTQSPEDKAASQLEVNTLVEGINNLAKSTNINGVNMIAADPSNDLNTVIGASGEKISIPTYNFTTDNSATSLLYSLSSIDVTTAGGYKVAMDAADAGMDQINTALSKYGALENRFTSTIDTIGTLGSETEDGDSAAIDADVAAEMLNYSRSSIIVQAGIAMMTQTNKMPQDVLKILSNV